MSAILKVENLSVRFGEFSAIENISFEIDGGDSLAIIGPNGSGKTVLIRALLGIVPYSGAIQWRENMRIGYVPQKIEADRHLPLNLRNLLAAKAETIGARDFRAESLAAETGLSEKSLDTPMGHLSGGEFQRALIAFALLGNPNVIILDEPTASIDMHGEERIHDLVHRLQDERGLTAIVVSHDLHFVYSYSTKVLCLNKSKVCFGEPSDALTPEVLEKVYGQHKYYHHYYHKQ